AARGALDRLRAKGATTTAVRELAAMARNPANGASLLVELKAVEAGYPLYGRVELALSRPLGELIGDGRSALVERSLLERLGLAVGDPLLLGTACDDARPGLRRFFSQLAAYLGLVGLASLFVGGIGVASSVVTFVRRQLATVAVLKCLGAESRMVLAAFLLQVLALGLLGSLAGAALGVLTQPVLVRAVQP